MVDEAVSATLTIPVPAATVFATLADPATHAAIDGTGWVQRVVDPEPLSEAGQLFRMRMYHADHPDGYYQVVNKIETFDPPHAVAWLTGTEHDDGRLEFGGWIWSYDLTPSGSSSTEVTLTYDWSAVPPYVREYLRFPPFGPAHLADSLCHLEGLVTALG